MVARRRISAARCGSFGNSEEVSGKLDCFVVSQELYRKALPGAAPKLGGQYDGDHFKDSYIAGGINGPGFGDPAPSIHDSKAVFASCIGGELDVHWGCELGEVEE